jgi:serine/threonine protein kinase
VLATDTVLGGRYLLGPVIGRGGVADVFRAEDRQTGEAVAVKVLRNATTTDLRRFEREARTLERLDHRCIVRLRDEGEHDGTPYLVLDLVDGEPLSQRLQRGRMAEAEVVEMGTCLAGALANAHDLGIVHRDVKPGNVLVDHDGSVHLTDFGIARLVDTAAMTSITQTGFVIGTAAYLAPEQVRGERAGPEADVYSLGLLVLEAVTGERAFEGSPTESALARLERSPTVPPLTPWLASLLTGMTSLDPAQRPRAATVADAFANRRDVSEHTAVLPVISEPTAAVAAMPAAAAIPAAASPAGASVASSPARASVFNGRGRLLAALAAVVIAFAVLLFTLGGTGSGSSPAGDTSSTSTSAVPTTVAPVSTSATVPPVTAPTPKPGKGKKGGDNKGDGGG